MKPWFHSAETAATKSLRKTKEFVGSSDVVDGLASGGLLGRD